MLKNHQAPSVLLVGIEISVLESISMSPEAPFAAACTCAGAGAAVPPRAAPAPDPAPRNVSLRPVFIVQLAREKVKGRCQLAHACARRCGASARGARAGSCPDQQEPIQGYASFRAGHCPTVYKPNIRDTFIVLIWEVPDAFLELNTSLIPPICASECSGLARGVQFAKHFFHAFYHLLTFHWGRARRPRNSFSLSCQFTWTVVCLLRWDRRRWRELNICHDSVSVPAI